MPLTVSPIVKGTLVIRFEDGTEHEIGRVTYRPDISLTINAEQVEYTNLD